MPIGLLAVVSPLHNLQYRGRRPPGPNLLPSDILVARISDLLCDFYRESVYYLLVCLMRMATGLANTLKFYASLSSALGQATDVKRFW